MRVFHPDFIFGNESLYVESTSNTKFFPLEFDEYKRDKNEQKEGVLLMVCKSLNGVTFGVETEQIELTWCRTRAPKKCDMSIDMFCCTPESVVENLTALKNIVPNLPGEENFLAGDFTFLEIECSKITLHRKMRLLC